jgi:hypothetical protein
MGHCIVGELERYDGEAKCASENLSQHGDIIKERVEGKYLGIVSNIGLFPPSTIATSALEKLVH